MQLNVVASGSAANCYILTAGKDRLILDAGVRWPVLQQALDFDYSGVTACLLSHGHKDHSKSLGELIDAGIDVYMSEGTAKETETDISQVHIFKKPYVQVDIGNWVVMPFPLQHDAKEPIGFLFAYMPTDEKFVYATDTFYLRQKFTGVHYWLIECNYCTDSLLRQYNDGEIDGGLYRRLLMSHMGLDSLKGYFKKQDMSFARKIVLIHMSDARGDERRMVDEITAITGVETVAADNGLTIELKKTELKEVINVEQAAAIQDVEDVGVTPYGPEGEEEEAPGEIEDVEEENPGIDVEDTEDAEETEATENEEEAEDAGEIEEGPEPRERKTYIGQCVFCHQSKTIERYDELSDEEVDELVTGQCTCSEAIRGRKLDRAYDSIKRLFGENAHKLGFDTSMDEEEIEFIVEAAQFVNDKDLKSITIQFADDDKGKISNKNSGIEVSRETKNKQVVTA